MIEILFVSCNINQFYLKVVSAIMGLLQNIACHVQFAMNQTCFGQPVANSVFGFLVTSCNLNSIKNFKVNGVILPSGGSCVCQTEDYLYGFINEATAS